MAVIGIDLGGTKISSALFRANGEMEGFTKVFLQNRKGKEVGELIRTQLRSLIRESGTDPVYFCWGFHTGDL
ncbi:MAG: hypothetical protein AB2L24_23205 [Mangrovibacterium sp.]